MPIWRLARRLRLEEIAAAPEKVCQRIHLGTFMDKITERRGTLPPAPKPEGRTSATRRAKTAGAAALNGSLPPVVERVTFLVHRVNARVAAACNPVFARYDVDLYSSRILALLFERTEMRVGELVDSMVLPQSTISHQLQRLEKRGLIRRRRTRADNRSVAVTLTPRGRQTAQECNDLSVAVYSTIIADFDAKEIKDLTRLLTKLFGTLGNFELPEIEQS